MNSDNTNTLIDFDSFDPFAPTPTQRVESTETSPSNVFDVDPFVDTFDDDNWQNAMQNINKNSEASNTFGETFDAFESSENFDSDWGHKQVPSTTISIPNNNGNLANHDVLEFNSTNYETQHVDLTNEELKFVGDSVVSMATLKLTKKEVSLPCNSSNGDSDVIQTDAAIKKNKTKASSVSQNYLADKENVYSLDEEAHQRTMRICVSNSNQNCDETDENLFIDCGKDVVNENLVFVSNTSHKFDLKIEQTKDDNVSESLFDPDVKGETCMILDKEDENVIEDNQNFDQLNRTSDVFLENKFVNTQSSLKEDITTGCERKVNKSETENEFPQQESGTSAEDKDSIASLSKDQDNHLMIKSGEDLLAEFKSNGIEEEDVKTNSSSTNERFEDLEFIEDRPRVKKGLAGLKEYDHNMEEEFSYSHPSKNERESSTSSAAEKVSSKIFNYGSSLENICKQCNKRVYEMEKITVDFVIYHKSCFRCATCKRMLSPSTYSATDGQIYCKADFLKNFKMKGSYTFSAESNLPINDTDNDERSVNEEETPVVPMKYMKNLFEKNEVQSEDMSRLSSHERIDSPDDKPEIIVSSNVYIFDDELPPPSLAKNLRAMFEHKSAGPTTQQATDVGMFKKSEKAVKEVKSIKMENEKPAINYEVEEMDGSDIPQAGMTRNLVAQWKDIEGQTIERERKSRGRDEKRSIGSMQRSQSSTRIEISQRLKVVSDDRPKLNVNISKEEGQYVRNTSHGQTLQSSNPSSKQFKWQVKEVTPLNRPGIVHGDLPKYQLGVGEIISEKTPISEINREEVYSRYSQSDESDEIRSDQPAKGSYVTEIREEELPDIAAVKSAMLRFKSMEDPSKEPPVPKNMAKVPSNRFMDQHHAPAYPQLDLVDDNATELQELPASGTTRSLLAKFQSN